MLSSFRSAVVVGVAAVARVVGAVVAVARVVGGAIAVVVGGVVGVVVVGGGVVVVGGVVVGGAGAGCDLELHLACDGDAQCPAGNVCHLGECLDPFVDCEASGGVDPPALVVRVHGASDAATLFCDALVVDENGAPLDVDSDDAGCFYAGGHPGDNVVRAIRFNFRDAVDGRFVEEGPCGAVTQFVTLVMGDVDGACDDDDDCAAGVLCVVAATRVQATCGGVGGVGDVGDLCDANAQCDHRLCDPGGVCSALCDDDGDCALSQTCEVDADLGGGGGGGVSSCRPRDDLTDIPCESNDDCADNGLVCDAVTDGALFCDFPPASAVGVGGECHDEGTTRDCESGLCDDDDDGRCTIACADDDECADVGLSICTSIAIDGIEARACFEKCERENDCVDDDPAGGRHCRARVDVVENAIVFACDGAKGGGELGEDVGGGGECASNFSITVGNGVTACSAPCDVDADCADAVAPMQCVDVLLQRPDGSTQQLSACVRTGA